MSLSDLISILDLVGVAVFAATGGLVASRKQMDIVGFALMAALTGIGGGTVRDLLVGRPVFWISEPKYLVVCFAIAVFIYFFAHRVQKRYTLLLWADAVGLAAFGVMGAYIATENGVAALPAIVFGVMTATFGGLARDIASGETPLLLKPEVYVTAAVCAAGTYIGLTLLPVPQPISVIAGILAGFAVRAGGIQFGWVLPRYKSRAGRDY